VFSVPRSLCMNLANDPSRDAGDNRSPWGSGRCT
jgi:hypothetical protein